MINDIITKLPVITDLYKTKVVSNIKDYWLTEKYDGYRTLCVNKKLYTRNGNQIYCPDWFTQLLPDDINLDGELFAGYGNWNLCGSFRRKTPDESVWKMENVIYIVFDIIDTKTDTPYHIRYKTLLNYVMKTRHTTKLDLIGIRTTPPIRIVSYTTATSINNIQTVFNQIVTKGGEGVVLRDPLSKYVTQSKGNIFRIKKLYMKEGIVVDYKISNSQKYKGLLSSFMVVPIADEDDFEHNIKKGQLLKQQMFSVSSGITEHIRKTYKDTFPIGTIIQYKCNDYTSTGKPRHPAFIRKREGTVTDTNCKLD